jgi:(2Fe-2S) ferredoxin
VTAYPGKHGDRVCIVRACRDCCCGTDRKHPGVDHEGLLARLEAGTRGHARVLRSDCLLVCDESNVVVVTPSRAGRRAGGRPVWLRAVLDEGTVDEITAWVGRGGPGMAQVPPGLAASAFAPPRLAVTYAPRDLAGTTVGDAP